MSPAHNHGYVRLVGGALPPGLETEDLHHLLSQVILGHRGGDLDDMQITNAVPRRLP